MSKLSPCPFCGGEASIEQYGNPRQSTIYQCNNCSCRLEIGEEWGHGKGWNARHEAEAAQIPDGWQMVPKCPTWQMLAALHGMEMPFPDIYGYFTNQERERAGQDAYRIMLEAAPIPGDDNADQ